MGRSNSVGPPIDSELTTRIARAPSRIGTDRSVVLQSKTTLQVSPLRVRRPCMISHHTNGELVLPQIRYF